MALSEEGDVKKAERINTIANMAWKKPKRSKSPVCEKPKENDLRASDVDSRNNSRNIWIQHSNEVADRQQYDRKFQDLSRSRSSDDYNRSPEAPDLVNSHNRTNVVSVEKRRTIRGTRENFDLNKMGLRELWQENYPKPITTYYKMKKPFFRRIEFVDKRWFHKFYLPESEIDYVLRKITGHRCSSEESDEEFWTSETEVSLLESAKSSSISLPTASSDFNAAAAAAATTSISTTTVRRPGKLLNRNRMLASNSGTDAQSLSLAEIPETKTKASKENLSFILDSLDFARLTDKTEEENAPLNYADPNITSEMQNSAKDSNYLFKLPDYSIPAATVPPVMLSEDSMKQPSFSTSSEPNWFRHQNTNMSTGPHFTTSGFGTSMENSIRSQRPLAPEENYGRNTISATPSFSKFKSQTELMQFPSSSFPIREMNDQNQLLNDSASYQSVNFNSLTNVHSMEHRTVNFSNLNPQVANTFVAQSPSSNFHSSMSSQAAEIAVSRSVPADYYDSMSVRAAEMSESTTMPAKYYTSQKVPEMSVSQSLPSNYCLNMNIPSNCNQTPENYYTNMKVKVAETTVPPPPPPSRPYVSFPPAIAEETMRTQQTTPSMSSIQHSNVFLNKDTVGYEYIPISSSQPSQLHPSMVGGRTELQGRYPPNMMTQPNFDQMRGRMEEFDDRFYPDDLVVRPNQIAEKMSRSMGNDYGNVHGGQISSQSPQFAGTYQNDGGSMVQDFNNAQGRTNTQEFTTNVPNQTRSEAPRLTGQPANSVHGQFSAHPQFTDNSSVVETVNQIPNLPVNANQHFNVQQFSHHSAQVDESYQQNFEPSYCSYNESNMTQGFNRIKLEDSAAANPVRVTNFAGKRLQGYRRLLTLEAQKRDEENENGAKLDEGRRQSAELISDSFTNMQSFSCEQPKSASGFANSQNFDGDQQELVKNSNTNSYQFQSQSQSRICETQAMANGGNMQSDFRPARGTFYQYGRNETNKEWITQKMPQEYSQSTDCSQGDGNQTLNIVVDTDRMTSNLLGKENKGGVSCGRKIDENSWEPRFSSERSFGTRIHNYDADAVPGAGILKKKSDSIDSNVGFVKKLIIKPSVIASPKKVTFVDDK